MALGYQTVEGLRRDNQTISSVLKSKPNWVVRKELEDGHLLKVINDRFKGKARIMDLGSGSGVWVKHLADDGYQDIIAVDLDDYLDYPEIRRFFRKADLNRECLPVGNESVEVVSAIQVIEHLENPWHFARECVRVLKPGGMLILSLPTGQTIWDKMKFLFTGNLTCFSLKNNHITSLTKDNFLRAFGRDFVTKEVFYSPAFVPRPLPRRLSRCLPANHFWSLKACYILERKDRDG